jgi:hypothetical protein
MKKLQMVQVFANGQPFNRFFVFKNATLVVTNFYQVLTNAVIKPYSIEKGRIATPYYGDSHYCIYIM